MNNILNSLSQFIQQQPVTDHGAFIQPNELVNCVAERQYWAEPYARSYLLLTFPNFDFQPTDVLALSTSEDQLHSNNVIDLVSARNLHGTTWTTACAIDEQPSEVFLHFYYIGSDAKPQRTVRKLALTGLAERPAAGVNDDTTARPRVSPQDLMVKALRNDAALVGAPDAGVAAFSHAVSALPYSKLFLSFDGWTFPQLNCYGVEGAAQANDYLAVGDHYPTSPTDHFKNGYCYVSALTSGVYYNFMVWANTWGGDWEFKKWHNANLWTLDLDRASTLHLWYVRWQNNQWERIGDVVQFANNHANWMRELSDTIGTRKLHELAIPGTHDSGCFDLYAKAATQTFSQSQNLTFTGQLDYGVRYFDLRLYLANDGGYYFNHGSTKTYSRIEDFVSALESFLGQTGNEEVVIADFSRFGQQVGSTFAPSDYEKILQLFTQSTILSPLLTNGAHATDTYTQLVESNKRLVLLCDQAAESWFTTITAELGISVGPSINIDAEWADTSSMDTLKSKLSKQVTNHANASALWSLQAQLTPIPLFQTMQEMAVACNAIASRWVRELWWSDVNVVFCDFITGGDLVPTLIECNRQRSLQ